MRFSRRGEGVFAPMRALYTPPSLEGKSLVLVFVLVLVLVYLLPCLPMANMAKPSFAISCFRFRFSFAFVFAFVFRFLFVFVFRPRRKHFRRDSPRIAANCRRQKTTRRGYSCARKTVNPTYGYDRRSDFCNMCRSRKKAPSSEGGIGAMQNPQHTEWCMVYASITRRRLL